MIQTLSSNKRIPAQIKFFHLPQRCSEHGFKLVLAWVEWHAISAWISTFLSSAWARGPLSACPHPSTPFLYNNLHLKCFLKGLFYGEPLPGGCAPQSSNIDIIKPWQVTGIESSSDSECRLELSQIIQVLFDCLISPRRSSGFQMRNSSICECEFNEFLDTIFVQENLPFLGWIYEGGVSLKSRRRSDLVSNGF